MKFQTSKIKNRFLIVLDNICYKIINLEIEYCINVKRMIVLKSVRTAAVIKIIDVSLPVLDSSRISQMDFLKDRMSITKCLSICPC